MTTYNVGLNDGVDYDAFWNEIENDGSGSTWVPNRAIGIVNERPNSLRQCWYDLTDDEAEKLRNDPRVFCVEIPPEFRTDIQIRHNSSQTNYYNKLPGAPYTYEVNWGLFRVNSSTNNTLSTDGTLTYNYPLDGTGVDIVIQDSGCQIDHPEFQDADGNSRVQQIDWYAASGVSGTMPPFANFYSDYNGHGTHVTGIAAGKTYGRAKNSRIYIMTLSDLCDSPSIGISTTDAFDTIKGWHNNKPVDPVLGYKRPTVVNMSWGYVSLFAYINGGSYRGTPWSGTTKQSAYGMIGNAYNYFGANVASVDLDVQELSNAGVFICGAAGNYSQTVVVSGDVDYNNYFNSSYYGVPLYYMRGGSPGCSPYTFSIGAVATDLYLGQESKASFSDSGNKVFMYAPGQNIVSAMSTTYNSEFNSLVSNYGPNSSYKIANVSGTSQASPQVAGLFAQMLQVWPNTTISNLRQKIYDTAVSNVLYSTGSSTDYANDKSLHGSANKYAYQSFNTATNVSSSGPVTVSNTSLDL